MEIKTLYNSTKFIEKDKLYRKAYKQNELLRNVLLSISKDQHLAVATRLKANLQLEEYAGSRSFIQNRCILSGRGRGVLRAYRVSRLLYRQLAVNGYLPGVSKASW